MEEETRRRLIRAAHNSGVEDLATYLYPLLPAEIATSPEFKAAMEKAKEAARENIENYIL